MRWPARKYWPEHPWHDLPDEALFAIPVARLGLQLEDTPLWDLVQNLYTELERAGLRWFKPLAYLGDEWFSPEGVPAIAIPFFLADPKLRALEARLMLDVEGGTPKTFMQLLRHEAGHAFDHAYKLSDSRTWQKLFGSPDKTYRPSLQRLEPSSKAYVKHLPGFYSQTHPCEDFAETFAIAVTPGSQWQTKYRFFPEALRKLEYVTETIVRYGNTRPKVVRGNLFAQAAKMRRTLGEYYRDRMRLAGRQHPAFFDHELKTIFPARSSREPADIFLERVRPFVIESTIKATGKQRYFVQEKYRLFKARCDALGLSSPPSVSEALDMFEELMKKSLKAR